MTCVSDFPTETLLHIFELICDDSEIFRQDGKSHYFDISDDHAYYHNLATLSSACLVCRQWRNVAQPIMWKELCLTRGVERVLASPIAGRFRTEELVIWLDGPSSFITSEELETFFSKLVGPRRLRFEHDYDTEREGYDQDTDTHSVDDYWLESTKLLDLEDLAIDVPFYERKASCRTSFKLSSLTVGEFMDSPIVLQSIITSSQNTLTFLKIEACTEVQSSLIELLPLLADSLETLFLGLAFTGLPELGTLSNFKQLKELTLSMTNINAPCFDHILVNLPSSVCTPKIQVTLTCRRDQDYNYDFLIERIGTRAGWKGATEIHIRSKEERIAEIPSGVKLLALCGQNDVDVRFGWY
ncbi:hypothetical protein P7C70_g2362, partial [Phenoliferia sp. Uapishka_3]